MSRAYYRAPVSDFVQQSSDEILGILSRHHSFSLEDTQRDAWVSQIEILQPALANIDGNIYFEFSIPRMGKRVDVLLVTSSVILVVEFKVGSSKYFPADIEQVIDYALDLTNFHEGSHSASVVPILVATEAKNEVFECTGNLNPGLSPVIRTNSSQLQSFIHKLVSSSTSTNLDLNNWEVSGYKPTPTIIEATLALYSGHSVSEISRSDAGATNLSSTSSSISKIIQSAKDLNQKAVVFVTGVPGSGKTLVGLDIATKHIDENDDLYSVFLSGNGPLVSVLQEALARDKVSREGGKLGVARSEVKAFIQNVHHFRDDGLADLSKKPPEHVVLFDESQRAWDRHQTVDFMKRKKGQLNFNQSEPEFLLSCMDRHTDWAVVVCLVGGGQEINKGEAGIAGWIDAVQQSFPDWAVYASNQMLDDEYGGAKILDRFDALNANLLPELHLQSSLRSFRSENVSLFVKSLLDLDVVAAKETLLEVLDSYPIVLTRDLDAARAWIKSKARGSERYGITVSSQAERLRPLGVHVKSPIDPVKWFLEGKDHVRSSYYMEEVATEFHVQGLELDWACVVWDADFRYSDDGWDNWSFKGNKWQKIRNEHRQRYQKNAYRVLLTRARQGMVLVVPEGNEEDWTRPSDFYDKTYSYLADLGVPLLC